MVESLVPSCQETCQPTLHSPIHLRPRHREMKACIHRYQVQEVSMLCAGNPPLTSYATRLCDLDDLRTASIKRER